MSKHFDVLIVGAGHGGAQVAMTLRRQGFEGTIGLLGEEPELPYDRPPLSKDYLSGDKPWERIVFHTAEAWQERKVELLLGRRATAVDPKASTVTIEDSGRIGYGNLVWAAGGAARRLSCHGHSLSGVHTIRNRADIERMMVELPAARDVVVIGGGYIGLEAAAVLRKFGKQVTLVEALDRVLARVAGKPLSHFYEHEHTERGVDIRLNARVECIASDYDKVGGVLLADGEVLPAQMVIVGIGIMPVVEPLLTAGAEGGNGVRVDDHCRTSLPNIYALGDCAEHRNCFANGEWVRLESVQNANDQAVIVADALMGGEKRYAAVPWFWSNQYDLKLQTIGLSTGFDDLIVRGDPATRSFSVIYLREGKVIALDCVNSVRDYSHGRLMLLKESMPDKPQLADPAVPLKSLL